MNEIVSRWDKRLRAWLGRGWPDDYLTFDYETTGLRISEDLAVDFGFCVVRGRKVVKKQGFILDWTRRPDLVEPEWLKEKLEKLAYIFSVKKKPWVYTVDYLRKHGRDPIKVLDFNLRLFQANRRATAMFVGHNAFRFDSALFHNMASEYLGEDWQFGPDELFDSGMTEKAVQSQAINNPRMRLIPADEESMSDFYSRCASVRLSGIYWSIERCVRRYALDRRFGIAESSLHSATADAHVCHLLFEEFRQMSGVA